LVSDEGQGIRAGHASVLSDVVRQSDTYHAIAHQLGVRYLSCHCPPAWKLDGSS
jgi:hypothetical protein